MRKSAAGPGHLQLMQILALSLLIVLPQAATAQHHSRSESPIKPAAESVIEQKDRKPDAGKLIQDKLGLRFAVLSSKIRRRIISTRTPYGFAIRKVHADSWAKQANLARGTIILELNGKPFRQIDELATLLRQAKPGTAIKMKCSRRRTRQERGPGRGRWIEFEVQWPPPKKKPAKKPVTGGKKGIPV